MVELIDSASSRSPKKSRYPNLGDVDEREDPRGGRRWGTFGHEFIYGGHPVGTDRPTGGDREDLSMTRVQHRYGHR